MTRNKILVVDDDPATVKLIVNRLKNLDYNVVATASFGEEAIRKASATAPDLVLMDIMLAGDLDGISAAEQIRKRFEKPVVFITAREDEETLQKAKLTEPLGYIHKPFKDRELRSAIEVGLVLHETKKKLKESQEQYRQLVDLSPDAIVVTNLEGNIFMLNKRFVELYSCGKDNEFTRLNLFDIVGTDDRQRIIEDVKQAQEQRVIEQAEYNLSREDGSTFPAEISISAMRNAGVPDEAFIFIVRDVTERKQSEEALRASQEYAKNIINSSLDMIIAVDKDRKIIEFNKAAEETFGYRREEVLGESVDLLYADTEEGWAVHETTLKTGRCVQEIRNKLKNGEIFSSVLYAAILRDSQGEKVGVMGISRDITDLKRAKRAEKALRESQAYAKNIVDSSLDMIIAVDKDRKITEFNKAASETLGYLPEEVIGKPVNILYADSQEGVEVHETTIEKGTFVKEILNRRKNGEIFPCLLSASVLRDEQGDYVGVMGVSRDITELKQAEENLKRSAVKYRLLSEQLTETHLIKDLLLDIITHDLKNPAGVISGMAEFLFDENPEDESIGLIKDSCDNLLKVIENTTTLSQVTFGEEIEKQKLDLAVVIQRALRGFEPNLRGAGMKVVHHLTEELIVQANPIISEVFKNYISNAIKYASEGRKIIIDSIQAKDSITISVKDFGTTIPEKEYTRIFERRAQLEKGKKPGRGIGLAIVKRIAEAHNGSVWVEANQPKGNVFFLKIPVGG